MRQGFTRARASFWPIVQASLAAGVAYGFARYVLGHEQPFFAAVAAWVCLGFTFDRQIRRVAEVAVGVAVGVGMGDLIVHLIGSGWWQLTVVLLFSALLGRFIDRGALLATQAGVQAIVVVGLPAVTGGALGRWTDALVGGVVALAVALLTPGDPRRRLRALAADATIELAQTLDVIARGLRARDEDELSRALVRGRATEPALEDWHDAASTAHDLARLSVNRTFSSQIARLEEQSVLVDRAMRSVRVLARRTPPVVRSEQALDVEPLADLVARYAAGVRLLASGLGAGGDLADARRLLAAVAADADPHALGEGEWQVQALVVLLRSPLVDTLEAAGMSPADARAALPEI
jgi:uncharacterized membrane protein YgaE (UPF0421/DUF939 family)